MEKLLNAISQIDNAKYEALETAFGTLPKLLEENVLVLNVNGAYKIFSKNELTEIEKELILNKIEE